MSSFGGSALWLQITGAADIASAVRQDVSTALFVMLEGVCAAVLLMGGGLAALQSASIATGLPFTVVLLVKCFSLYRGLQEEHYHATIIEKMEPETQRIEIPLTQSEPSAKQDPSGRQ
ncbi:MAG: BCCT family transporter [Desulfobacterales bacterium]